MSRPYHALQAAHGYNELALPEDDAELRLFCTKCMETREFQSAASERHQIHLCARWAQEQSVNVSLQQLANFFQIAKSTVQYHLSRPFDIFDGCQDLKTGRPSVFTDDQIDKIVEVVHERFNLRMPVSYEEIRDFVEDSWGIIVPANTLRAIVGRCASLKTVTGTPLEDSRLFASEEKIEAYFVDLEETIRIGNIPAAFVINVDESGFDQFVDARSGIRIVPTSYEQKSVPVAVTRAEKRATLIAAICGDGTALRPMVIVQRETVEKELLLRGYTADKVYLSRSDTGFVTSRLFLEWGTRVFFPELRRRRAELGYQGPAVLVMDGFGCHQTERFLELAAEENIITKFIPPHTSDQLQPLDLGIFANQKRWQGNITVDADLNRQTKQIIKSCDSYRMATTPKNVIGAFRKGGLVTWLDDTTLLLMIRVDPSLATALRHGDGNEGDVNPQAKQRVRI